MPLLKYFFLDNQIGLCGEDSVLRLLLKLWANGCGEGKNIPK